MSISSTKEELKQPKLRFPEFEGDWEVRKLGEFTSWSSGGTPSKKQANYWNGDIPWISASSMRGIEYYTSNVKITEEGLRNGTKLAPKGVLLLLVRGSILFKRIPIGITQRDVAFNQDVKAIKILSLSFSKYILYWFLASETMILNMVTGTGIGAGKLDLADLKALKVKLPSLPEQQKIASFLSVIDHKRQILAKQKTLWTQYKKGIMQQLFSQQIRFKQENGEDFADWEELKGKDIFKSHSNKKHNGDLPILSASQEHGMVYRDKNGIQIQSSTKSILSYKVVEPGDFIISLRSFQGGLELSNLKGICSPAYTVLKPKIKINTAFFKFYFKKESFIERLSKTVVGIRDGKQISYDAFGHLKLPFPSLPEQQKIASFLNSIDQKIQALDRQVVLMDQYKRALLQQLFC